MSCLPCNMMDLLSASVGRAAAEACPCKTALGFMIRLGAKHAAKAHAGDYHGTPEEEELHMREEEVLFFPLIRPYSESEYQRFLREHKLFRSELKKHGKIISLDVRAAHAARENMWAERLMREMDEKAGANVSGISVERLPKGVRKYGIMFTRVGAESSYKPSAGLLAAGFVTLLGAGFVIAGAIQSRYFQ